MCELSAGAAGGGSSLVLVHRHLTMVAPAVVEHGVQGCGLQQLWRAGLVVPRRVASSQIRG